MSWEKYRKTAKHNFKEFGCPGFWVELLRLDSQLYGDRTDATEEFDDETSAKLKALVVGGLSDEEASIQIAIQDPETAQKLVDLGNRQLAKHIVNWNLTDPKTNEELPLPTEDDFSSFDALPREFVTKMNDWLREDSELAQRIPKRKGT